MLFNVLLFCLLQLNDVETKSVTCFTFPGGIETKQDKSKLEHPVVRPRIEMDSYRILFRSYTNFCQFVGNHLTFWKTKPLAISWTNPRSNILVQWHWKQNADGKILQRVVIVNISFKLSSHWKKGAFTPFLQIIRHI